MEIVIVVCLLIVIVLLAKDKIVIKKVVPKEEKQLYVNPNLPEIMGSPKPKKRLSVPTTASKSQTVEPLQEIDNFESEIEVNDFDIEIPQEEPDEVFREVPDYEEEEEEWKRYRDIDGDDTFGFATGVTFEELSSVGLLLQKEKLEPSQKETAVAIVQKIQGTELFDLLENSMESASRKIAELLNESLSSETDAGSSSMRKNNLEEFDIGEFV